MDRWTTGYTRSQLDAAQDRYGLRFPPDLTDLYLNRQPANAYDWSVEDPKIRRMLQWPFEALQFDIENGFWWSEWGDRPSTPEERAEVLRDALARAPKLIPLYSHRYLPEVPGEAGNPVFSMHGFDTIYYGSDLANYFAREFGDQPKTAMGAIRHIPFWSDITERSDDAYAYYAAYEDAHAMIEGGLSQFRTE